uniref:Uncharacterized protein n=1 Tax=Oryza glumipatula TaxID=40148 RepID=A0A0E0A5C6_9ORYZ
MASAWSSVRRRANLDTFRSDDIHGGSLSNLPARLNLVMNRGGDSTKARLSSDKLCSFSSRVWMERERRGPGNLLIDSRNAFQFSSTPRKRTLSFVRFCSRPISRSTGDLSLTTIWTSDCRATMFLTTPVATSKPEDCLKNFTLAVLVSCTLCPANKCLRQLRLPALTGSFLISVALMSSVSRCFRFPRRCGNLDTLVFLRLRYFSWKNLHIQCKVSLLKQLQPCKSSTLNNRSCGKKNGTSSTEADIVKERA